MHLNKKKLTYYPSYKSPRVLGSARLRIDNARLCLSLKSFSSLTDLISWCVSPPHASVKTSLFFTSSILISLIEFVCFFVFVFCRLQRRIRLLHLPLSPPNLAVASRRRRFVFLVKLNLMFFVL